MNKKPSQIEAVSLFVKCNGTGILAVQQFSPVNNPEGHTRSQEIDYLPIPAIENHHIPYHTRKDSACPACKHSHIVKGSSPYFIR